MKKLEILYNTYTEFNIQITENLPFSQPANTVIGLKEKIIIDDVTIPSYYV